MQSPVRPFPVDPMLKGRVQSLKALLNKSQRNRASHRRGAPKSRGRSLASRFCQFVKLAALLALAVPPLLFCVAFGFGRAFALIVAVCMHIAPDTSLRAIHSRPVMIFWELLNKGM